MNVTESSKIPFGRKHKNQPIGSCPSDYLHWIIKNLWETDFHNYAVVAKKILESRGDEEHHTDLEQAANDILRKHGFDPHNLHLD